MTRPVPVPPAGGVVGVFVGVGLMYVSCSAPLDTQTVMVLPFDAGPTRVAILRDPQGVVFTASRFDPEAL